METSSKVLLGNLTEDRLADIIAGYLKRLLENPYTNFFSTPAGEQLKSLGLKTKHIVEFILYYFSSGLDKKLPENNLFQKVFKEVLKDAPSEISKRIINGDKSPEIKSAVRTIGKEKLLSLILGLDAKDLNRILAWLQQVDGEKQSRLLSHLSKLNLEELSKIACLSQENKNKLVQLLENEFFSGSNSLQNDINATTKRLRQYIDKNRKKGE